MDGWIDKAKICYQHQKLDENFSWETLFSEQKIVEIRLKIFFKSLDLLYLNEQHQIYSYL